MIPIVITLITEEEGSEELLAFVEDEMQRLETQLNVNITIKDVDRFGKEMYRKQHLKRLFYSQMAVVLTLLKFIPINLEMQI